MTRRILLSALLLVCSPLLHAAADREASRAAVMIPIAGTVAGANGTRFQTDVTLTNQGHSSVPTLVDVYWLPNNAAGTGAPLLRLTLAHGAIEFYEDFVTNTLHQTGLGTIIFRAVNEDGSPNLAGRIDAFARVWTPVAHGVGTTSQSVHASTLYSPPVDDFQPISGMIYGLLQNGDFRSNYGLVNMGTKRLTFTVTFLPRMNVELSRSEQVTVEPQSMTHRAVPASITGPVTIIVRPHQEANVGNPTVPPVPWTAYGSSVDNVTGDAWYSKAQASYPHNN